MKKRLLQWISGYKTQTQADRAEAMGHEKRPVAFHEAGHCYAMLKVDIAFRHVEIFGKGPRWGGQVVTVSNIFTRAGMISVFAGGWAQRLYFEVFENMRLPTAQSAPAYYRNPENTPLGGDFTLIDEAATTAGIQGWGLLEVARDAQGLVIQNFRQIAKVADALHEGEYLTMLDVENLL